MLGRLIGFVVVVVVSCHTTSQRLGLIRRFYASPVVRVLLRRRRRRCDKPVQPRSVVVASPQPSVLRTIKTSLSGGDLSCRSLSRSARRWLRGR